MMYCKYCGAIIADGVKFCGSCGATASASTERIEPKAAKPEENFKKREPGDISYNKGANYYTYDNSMLNHDGFEQSNVNSAPKPIQYTENFGNLGGSFEGGHKSRSFNKANKPLGFFTKVVVTVLSLGVGAGIGYFICNLFI